MVKTSPSNAWGVGSIPGWGSEVPHASWPKNQNIKQEQYFYKLNTLKIGPHQKKKKNLKKKTKESLRMGPCVKSAFSRATEPIG